MASLRKIHYYKNGKPMKNSLVPILIKCKQCGQQVNDSVVRYQNSCYHLKCFVCSQCKRSMRELKVYYDDTVQKLFCEVCYLKSLDRCTGCSKEIFDEMVNLPSGSKYHRDCFRCDRCKEPLENFFFEYEGKNYCRNDYLRLFMPICARCKEPIQPEQDSSQTIIHISFQNQNYHPNCFVCDQCQCGLDCEPKMASESSSAVNIVGPATGIESDQSSNADLSITASRSQTANVGGNQFNKIFYPIDGLKLCKQCAINRKQKSCIFQKPTTATNSQTAVKVIK